MNEEVVSLMERFKDACAANPDVPRPEIMVLRHTYVADSEADALRAADEINRFYCYFGAWFMNKKPVSQGLIERLTEEEIANHPFNSPEAARKNQIIGEPDEVIARVKSYEALGYDQFAFWIDSGMSFERKKASLERFIGQVMPAFS